MATIVAFSVSVVAVESGPAVETNPVALAVAGPLGWTGAGLIAVGGVHAIFTVYRRVSHIAPRVVSAGSTGIVLLSLVDLLWSSHIALRAGLKGGVGAGAIASVVVVAAAAVGCLWRPLRNQIRFPLSAVRPSKQTARTAIVGCLALILIISSTAGLASVISIESSAVGVASAASESAIDTFEDGDISGWSGPASISSKSFDGEYSLEYTGSGDAVTWDDGPAMVSDDSDYVTGTVRWEASSTSTDIGSVQVVNGGGGTEYKLRANSDGNEFQLQAHGVSQSFGEMHEGTWYRFRMIEEGADIKAKAWEVGTEEPSSWGTQMTMVTNDNDYSDGRVAVSSPGESVYLDAVGVNTDVTSPTVSGNVTSSGGDPISEARIEVLQDGSLVENTTTDASGSYVMDLDKGTYTFSVSKSGYKSIKESVTVSGVVPKVNFSLSKPGTSTPETLDYRMDVCYKGDAEFQSVGADATWNPYPTSDNNSWAPSEFTGDQSTTEFNRYGETTLEDAHASPNVSYRVGVESERASFVFDGVNPTEQNTRGEFEIASPFEDWLQDPADISSSANCVSGATASGTTTPMPTPVGTPPADGDMTALGTCTVPGSDGAKTGLLVEYWDPSMSTEDIWFNLSYAGTSINEYVEFDSPKGYYFGCHAANDGISTGDRGTPTPYPEPTAFPNGTEPTPYPQPTAYPDQDPPTLNGSANYTDGGSSNFSEIGFADTDPANSLNGSLSGGFGPTGGGGSGGSPIVGFGLVAAVGYGALRFTGNDKRVAKAARRAVGRIR
ncbi:carboxypeptidase-like regulatory domain-containing protein [Halosimplex sp. TS25]|uniref:carboxypeptidase-like regulatory domain-containing protein n=1 Tax=Halosimplex rarum TaxID=3396619 RepID=UPI0039E84C62